MAGLDQLRSELGVLALLYQPGAPDGISVLLGNLSLLLIFLSSPFGRHLLHCNSLLPQSTELPCPPPPYPLLNFVCLSCVSRVWRSLPSRQDDPGKHTVQYVVGQVSRVVGHLPAHTCVQPRPVTSCCLGDMGDGGNMLSVDNVIGREIINVDWQIL